jgi:hypothetical protein
MDENNVSGGSYPVVDGCLNGIAIGSAPTNCLPSAASIFHRKKNMPHGKLKILGAYKREEDGKMRLKLRFDDAYNMAAWIEFDVDCDEFTRQIAQAKVEAEGDYEIIKN